MKKIICKKEYDTATATVVKKTTHGYYGDPAGYEQTLYQTPEGLYFEYTCGGPESDYAGEDIKRVAQNKAEAWIQEHN